MILTIPANIVLLGLASLILLTRGVAFFICKAQEHSLHGFKLHGLFRQQPWLPALLILLAFVVNNGLEHWHLLEFKPALDFVALVGLGLVRAVCSIWLLIAEANAIYAWLSQVVAKKSLSYALLPYIKNGVRYTFLVLSLPFILASFPIYPQVQDVINKVIQIVIIWTIAWLLMQVISALEKATLQRLKNSLSEDFHARRVYTQIRVFKRIIIFIILLLAFAATAMTFDNVRELGTSILASAGLATVILGFAAQKTLGNLFVGVQIAITQPIRINDLVSIEGELGTVEEITLSHVILRIWDLRRLVIPISYFIDKPFQNLSRTSTELLSPIFFYTDYNLPVEAIRQAFMNILQQSPLWDGKVAKLQVVDTQGNILKVRAVASVRNSSDAWDLKCEILEKLTAFIVKNHPDSLPKTRSLQIPVQAAL